MLLGKKNLLMCKFIFDSVIFFSFFFLDEFEKFEVQIDLFEFLIDLREKVLI